MKKSLFCLFLAAGAALTAGARADAGESSELILARMDFLYSACLKIDRAGAAAGKKSYEAAQGGKAIRALRLSADYKSAMSNMQLELQESTARPGGLDDMPWVCQQYGFSSATHDLSETLSSQANQGDVEGVKRLLVSGASVKHRDTDGSEPLHLAARGGGIRKSFKCSWPPKRALMRPTTLATPLCIWQLTSPAFKRYRLC
ncbi:MAG: ankyrin repeat domain-containing protein [Polaromonas sp.]|nr:hypothetical protein [Polaromonas sp.]NMM04658.1 ankyrin repeat domain-containing protein [Polaromonas sp.]